MYALLLSRKRSFVLRRRLSPSLKKEVVGLSKLVTFSFVCTGSLLGIQQYP